MGVVPCRSWSPATIRVAMAIFDTSVEMSSRSRPRELCSRRTSKVVGMICCRKSSGLKMQSVPSNPERTLCSHSCKIFKYCTTPRGPAVGQAVILACRINSLADEERVPESPSRLASRRLQPLGHLCGSGGKQVRRYARHAVSCSSVPLIGRAPNRLMLEIVRLSELDWHFSDVWFQ